MCTKAALVLFADVVDIDVRTIKADMMIDAKLLRDEGILVVTPSGRLESADFDRLRALVDPYIEDNGVLTGLLIHAESFPGWDNFSGMLSHLHFVSNYQREISRVAAVTDSGFLSILPSVASHFITAKVRHFDFQDRELAMNWLQTGLDIP